MIFPLLSFVRAFITIFRTLYLGTPRSRFRSLVRAGRIETMGEERTASRTNGKKKHSEILWQVLSPSTDDSFRQIDSYSPRDVTIRRVTLGGASRVSHLTPSDNHIRVIRSTNIGDDNAHECSRAAVAYFLVLNRTRATLLPLPDEVTVHGVEYQKFSDAFVGRN